MPPSLERRRTLDVIREEDYRALAEFRFALRRYLAFAESAATAAGLPPQQYQALLVVRSAEPQTPMTVGVLAEQLLVAPHTALELVRRLESGGYLRVAPDPRDRRRRLLALSAKANRILEKLSSVHLTELGVMGPGLAQLLTRLVR